jgi:tRNA (cytidine/uridine-2'-O-)-methyltransferase
VVTVHKTIEDAWRVLQPERVYAFTSDGTASYADITYRPGDVLMFGQESVGLPEDVKRDPHVTATVRLPMLPSLRSLNLANAASIAVYEAWRQQGFAGAQI